MAAAKDDGRNGDLQEHLISVRRVAKVVKGGRIFGFSALTVVGDGKGRVGIGRGKAREVPLAVQKAMESARRDMSKVHLNKSTVQYTVMARHGGARVVMRPASEGTGIIAGASVRAVLEAAGVKDILTKAMGSKNPMNLAKATLEGLRTMKTRRSVSEKRGVQIR